MMVMNRRLYKFSVDLFLEYLSKVQGKRMRVYRCNDNDVNSWNYFCKFFQEKKVAITEEFIRKFVEYGMHSWFNKDVGYTYQKNVRFSWIFGSGAIKRWYKLPPSARQYYVNSELKKNYNVKRKKTSSPLLSKLLDRVRPIEERFKQEYLNTPRGLLWCTANTTLFLHKSPTCTICEFKDECKENLRRNMPNVYKLRGYK